MLSTILFGFAIFIVGLETIGVWLELELEFY